MTAPRAIDPVTNEPIPLDEKPAYQSRTVMWLASSALVLVLKKVFDVDLPDAEADAMVEALIIAAGYAFGIYYRIRATKKVKEGPVAQAAATVIEPTAKIVAKPIVALTSLRRPGDQ